MHSIFDTEHLFIYSLNMFCMCEQLFKDPIMIS